MMIMSTLNEPIEVFVTDLDHTLLHPETEDLPENLPQLLETWMDEGNVWVIATGRDQDHLETVMDELGVLPNFYITRSRYIHAGQSETSEKIHQWNSHIEDLIEKQYQYADVWIPDLKSWAEEQNIPVTIQDRYVEFDTVDGAEEAFHYLSNVIDNDFKVLRNREFLIVVPRETGKGNCLKYLSDIMDWQESEIFCVGDGMNDANMLDGDFEFGKAVVSNAEPQLKDLVKQHGGIILEHVGGHAIKELLDKLIQTHVK